MSEAEIERLYATSLNELSNSRVDANLVIATIYYLIKSTSNVLNKDWSSFGRVIGVSAADVNIDQILAATRNEAVLEIREGAILTHDCYIVSTII